MVVKKVRLCVQVADWIPQEVVEEFVRLLCEDMEFKGLCQVALHEAMDSVEIVLPDSTADMEIGPGGDVFEDLKVI